MGLVVNVAAIVAAWVWTAVVGVPLVLVLQVQYGLARAAGVLGWGELPDRALEWNAFLTCWTARHLWSGVLLRLFGVRLRVRESEPVDWARAHVLCANHASLFDIVVLARVVPPPFRVVAKRELLKWPVIGWLMRPSGQIVVDRRDRAAAVQSLREAATHRVAGQVVFFVEGTRTRTGRLQPFKKGAFHFAAANGLPVLPMAIRGTFDVLGRVPWWRVRRGGRVDVVFGPVLAAAHPGVETTDDAAEEFATVAREEILQALSGIDA